MNPNDNSKDLDFLKEMKERLNKAPFDTTEYQMVDEMIGDWIRELEEKCSTPPTEVNEVQPSPRKSYDECWEMVSKDKDSEGNWKYKGTSLFELHRLAAELYASQTQWRDVKQELPEDGECVLAFNGFTMRETSYQKHTCQDADWFKSRYTHWMPKPNQ